MRRYDQLSSSWKAAALVGLVLAGCGTLQVLDYRTVQNDFEQAVRADNSAGLSALTGETRYEQVVAELTDEYIGELDLRLQANAWMLRAFSEWRAGKLAAARQSAGRGLATLADQDHPASLKRDELVLTMIPALVIDSETMTRWRDAGRTSTVELSDELAASFETAMLKLDEAAELLDEVSEGAANYYHYQRWRILRNWGQVITSLEVVDDSGAPDLEATRQARRDARAKAAEILGITSERPTDTAAEVARDQITGGDPLLELIRLHEAE